MKYALLLFLCCPLFAQELPDYSNYTLLLVGPPPVGGSVVPMLTAQRQLEFIPTSSASKAMSGGATPVHYGDVLQLLRNVAEENQRLTTENERLWVIAGKPQAPTAPVVVQVPPAQTISPQAQEYAARQEMRMTLMRSLLAPRSSSRVNYNYDCSKYPAACIH